ncbi:MAG: hypothetical protein WC058_03725 [Phycisphaeraceae bacterium]
MDGSVPLAVSAGRPHAAALFRDGISITSTPDQAAARRSGATAAVGHDVLRGKRDGRLRMIGDDRRVDC